MNKRIACILILLLGLTSACGQTSGPADRSTPTSPPAVAAPTLTAPLASPSPSPAVKSTGLSATPAAAAAERILPVSVPPAIPGLYLPAGTHLEGNLQRAVISSQLPCASLFSALGAGEWRMLRQVTWTGLGDAKWLALLERGETQLSVRASAMIRGAEKPPAAAPTAAAKTPAAATPTAAAPKAPAAATAAGEYCVAVVQAVSRQPLRAQGQVTLSGDALQFPFCSISAGKASLSLYYQVPGSRLALLKATFPAQLGEHPLAREDEITLNLIQNIPDLFAYYTRVALISAAVGSGQPTPTPEPNQPTPSGLAFTPGQNFSGKVTLSSQSPLVGKLALNGLVSEEADTLQSFEASFACTPPEDLPQDMVDLRPIERPEISLSLEMRSDIGVDSAFGLTETAAVHLAGVLKATSPDTYRGQWQASGQGSFSSWGSDFKPCTNTWTGKQLLRVDGRLAGGKNLTLSFSPAAKPQVQYENTCGVDLNDPGFLPVSNTQLKGKTKLELAWPPDAAGNAHQTVDGHQPLAGKGDFGTWQADFGK